jgi:aspartate/methionine/tyrosine aminotransferase
MIKNLSPVALELNTIIERENKNVLEMFSALGRRIYFPKGILSQSAEAAQKAKNHDATIGIAKENGKAMGLPSVLKYFSELSTAEVLNYAPAPGRVDLRKKWKEELFRKNPSLQSKQISLPVVSSGVTHGLSACADLFVDKGDVVILPDKYWENYNLIFGIRREAKLKTFPLFAGDGFNLSGLDKILQKQAKKGKIVLVLNFPNNPTGYTPTAEEAQSIFQSVLRIAQNGTKTVVIVDDAYFGLFYGEKVFKESIFSLLAEAHENLLAIKVDGPTKEQYVWGLRTGFITFSTRVKGDAENFYGALEKKIAGIIRGTISNCSNPAQSIIFRSLSDPAFLTESAQKKNVLESRAQKVKEILASSRGAKYWVPYPFNSGYFMCVRLKKLDAEKYRKHLLDQYGIGVIAEGKRDIRIAFSSIENTELENLFEVLEKAAKELSENQTGSSS